MLTDIRNEYGVGGGTFIQNNCFYVWAATPEVVLYSGEDLSHNLVVL
jgi:hypothetical protein